jgi:hypothetical protein
MSKRKPPVPVVTGSPDYNRTPEDLASLATIDARRKARGRPAEIRTELKGNVLEIRPDHPDTVVGGAVLANAMGAASAPFVEQLLNQIMAGAKLKDGTIDVVSVNAALAVTQGIQPRDEVEAMLAAQMVAINRAMVKAAGMFDAAHMLPQWTAGELALNRLARTYAQQVDTLKRYRSTGEQKVTVQHVTVNEGGQAVVGEVHHNGAPAGQPPALDYAPGVVLDAIATPERGRDGR